MTEARDCWNIIIDVDVSFDVEHGWTHSFSNFYDNLAVIEVSTSLVVDFAVLSLFCSESPFLFYMSISYIDHIFLYLGMQRYRFEGRASESFRTGNHASECTINYVGNSGAMEVSFIYIYTYRYKYISISIFCFCSLVATKQWSPLVIAKLIQSFMKWEECPNHVSKHGHHSLKSSCRRQR